MQSEIFSRRIRSLSGKVAAAGFLCAVAALLAFPREVQAAVKGSIIYCLTTLVPSLFPFMVLAGFAADSAVGETLGKCFGGLTRRIFKLPEVCSAAILMSFIGGYPAGARSAAVLLKRGKITERQAGRMLMFCVNPGTAFVVTYLGGTVFGNYALGWAIFASVTVAGILLGIISGVGVHAPQKATADLQATTNGAMIRSVSGAATAVLKMCACIVLFSGVTAILHGTGIYQRAAQALAFTGIFTPTDAAVFFSFIIEVTGGVGAAGNFRALPELYAFGLAFGGLCVHLQVFSFFENLPIKLPKFFLFRFLHGGLAAVIFCGIRKILPAEFIAATAPIGVVSGIAPLSGSIGGGLSLLMMCAAFLLAVGKLSDELRGHCA